jgi:hypothetical protein
LPEELPGKLANPLVNEWNFVQKIFFLNSGKKVEVFGEKNLGEKARQKRIKNYQNTDFKTSSL